MQFMIADSFLEAAAALDKRFAGRIWEFVSKLRSNPAHPGLSLERVGRWAQFWSARVSGDVRAIFAREGDAFYLLHVNHHDPAYAWAETRRVSVNDNDIKLLVSQEEEQTPTAPVPPPTVDPGPERIFADYADTYLVSLGVPESWLPCLRQIGNEDQLLTVCEQLPPEVAERLLDLADGNLVTPPAPTAGEGPKVVSGRFYVVDSDDELQRILSAPMERWLAFLHPTQRSLAYGQFQGPVKATGAAGTGKTVVAMHRARYLAGRGRRVLLTTYTRALTENLRRSLELLCAPEELARISVDTVFGQAMELARSVEPHLRALAGEELRGEFEQWLTRGRRAVAHPPDFILIEWERVIAAQAITSWAEYRSARRTGRGRPLTVKERKLIWDLLDEFLKDLRQRGREPLFTLPLRAAEWLEAGRLASPFAAVVVDELQDLKPPEIRLLKALVGTGPDSLLLVGDAGQRIYPGGFSLASLGIETRGRSRVLRINYRTTEQIRRFADRLRGRVDDFDGGSRDGRGARSLLRGPEPEVHRFERADDQVAFVARVLQSCLEQSLQPQEVALFARTRKSLESMADGLARHQLTCSFDPRPGAVRLSTLHGAKGLEFKTAIVIDCSHSQVPLRSLLQQIEDPADREEAERQERNLLYVGLTRARDEMYVTAVGKLSPYLEKE